MSESAAEGAAFNATIRTEPADLEETEEVETGDGVD